jgi:diketogulonate reductase-like aldo/keto reductase
MYGLGTGETNLGKAMKELGIRRKKVVISTKIFKIGNDPNDCFLSRKHIVEGLKNSLQRLQLKYVDVVYCHRFDSNTPLEEVCDAMNYIIDQGLAFYWGTSGWSASQIMETYSICDRLGLIRPICEQTHYNLFTRSPVEDEYNDLIKKYKLGLITYSPLECGILTGKYIFKLWPKLPKKFRNYNLATIYSLSRKKVNMKSILELSSKYPKNLKILILIETEQEELFGMILPQMLEDTGEDKYIKLEKCYLINFLPIINVYKDNNEIICEKMLCCNKKGLWLCKEQVDDLIFIDGTLDEGNTCKKNTYFGNITLTKKGNFLIKDFEIIVLVENKI